MDDAELSALPVFDRDATMDRLDGDQELFKELIEIFLTDSKQQLDSIRASIQAGDATETSQLAHAIKGALGNIGAMKCHRLALELERRGKAGVCDAQVFAQLETNIATFLSQVK